MDTFDSDLRRTSHGTRIEEILKPILLVLPLTMHFRIIPNVCGRARGSLRGMTRHGKQHARKDYRLRGLNDPVGRMDSAGARLSGRLGPYQRLGKDRDHSDKESF